MTALADEDPTDYRVSGHHGRVRGIRTSMGDESDDVPELVRSVNEDWCGLVEGRTEVGRDGNQPKLRVRLADRRVRVVRRSVVCTQPREDAIIAEVLWS